MIAVVSYLSYRHSYLALGKELYKHVTQSAALLSADGEGGELGECVRADPNPIMIWFDFWT